MALHAAAHLDALRQQVAKDAPCIIADFEEAQSEVTYITPSSYEDAVQVHLIGAALAAVSTWPSGSAAHNGDGRRFPKDNSDLNQV